MRTELTRFIRLLATGVLALMLGATASATTYYVRTTGLDTNNGTSAATAFKTVQKALSLAQAGDSIYIGKGTFTGAVTSVRAGTATAPIRLFGDTTGAYTGDKGTPALNTTSGTTVTITHNYIEFQQITITGTVNPITWSGTGGALRSLNVTKGNTGAIKLTGGTLLLATCNVYSSTSDAINVTNGTITLNGCTVRNNTGRAVVINGASAAATVDRNTFYTNTGYTIDLVNGSLTLSNNLIRNTTNGVQITAGTAKVWNNTFYIPGTNGVLQNGGTVAVFNNIFCQASNALAYTAGTLTHNNNLYWQNTNNYTGTTAGVKDLYADPKFTSASNWKLLNSSPAIDTGADASSVTKLDRVGAIRPLGPAYDIGAYEVTGPSKTVPYFTDFEATSTPGTEWTATGVLTSTQSTRFAGPYANNTLGLRLTTTPGTDYTLIFDVYFLNTWDGDNASYGPDNFGVGIDGDVMFRNTYAYPGYGFPWNWPDQAESWRIPFTGVSNQVSVMRSVVVDFTAQNTVTFVTFFGENLQGWSDEGWGIDNVRVVTAANSAQYRPAFAEIGRLSGFDQVVSAGEAAGLFWGDFNNDGLIDVIQGGGATSRYSINTAGSFSTSTFTNFVRQGAVADFDSDGFLDFWGIGPKDALTLMINNAAGTLTATSTGITKVTNNEAVAAADLNGDGYCDLALFSGNGNWAVMADASSISQAASVQGSVSGAVSSGSVAAASPGNSANAPGQIKKQALAGAVASAAPTWTLNSTVFPTSALDAGDGNFCSSADVNNDGYLDFFYHFSTGRLFLSNGDGTYTSSARGIKISTSESDKMGSVWGDFNNDGNADLFVGSRNGTCTLWQNPGAVGNFTDVASAKGVALATGVIGCDFGDYDNDGNLDLFLTLKTGQAVLYRNQGSPNYTFVAMPLAGASCETAGGDVCFVDQDNDGNLDLAFTSESSTYPSLLFQNQNVSTNFLEVRVIGRGTGGINRAGVGTRIELWDSSNKKFLQRREIGVAEGYAGQAPLVAHFGGLNPATAYTLRLYNCSKNYTVSSIKPGSVSTTIGATVIPQMYTFDENTYQKGIKIVRWREQSMDE